MNTYNYFSVAGGRLEDLEPENQGAGITNVDETQIYTNAIFQRFIGLSELKTIIDVQTNLKTILLEQGDQVLLTHDKVMNFATGDRGVTNTKGLVVGQSFDFKSGNLSHRVALFEIPAYLKNSKAGDIYYTIEKILEADIDDTALAVDANETTTTQAADAYYDNSGTLHEADVLMLRFRLTPPAFGAGSDFEYIELKISAMSAAPAFLYFDYRRYINFNPQSAVAFEFDLYLWADAAGLAPDRVKVDWIATTAAGGEVPTLEFIELWFIDFSA